MYICFLLASTHSFDVTLMMKKGITYSVLSSSWDEDREGSGFGADEFQKNIGNIKEGLSRTKGEGIVFVDFDTCNIPNSCHTVLTFRRKCIAEREDGRAK